MADVKQQLTAAGCPPELAVRLEPKVGAARTGGLFGNLQFLRKLLALYQKDGALVRDVLPQIIALIQTGDIMGLLTLAQTRGGEVWTVVTDIIDLFDLNPAPPAFEAGVSER